MSQNASRSTKGGGPPAASGSKVFSKQGQDISNVKFSHNNNNSSNTFNNNKNTKLLNNNATTNTNTNANGSLDENHNQQHHVDKNGTAAQPLKPTAEQVRLASLLNGKSDDPEINKKIKQVLDIFPDKNQDEVLMALHETDYDVSKAINLIVEGNAPIEDWTTVGLKKKPSANQTGDEVGETSNQSGIPSSGTSFGKNKNNSNNNSGGNGNNFNNSKNQRSKDRDRDRTRGGGGSSRPSRKFNDSNFNNDSNNNNLDERFENLDIKDGDFKSYNNNNNFGNSDINGDNGNNSNENDYNGRSNSNKRSNFRNSNGGMAGSGSGRGRGGGSSGRNNNNRSNNNGYRSGGGFQRGPRNENFNNRNKDFNNQANISDENNLINENELTSNNENLNEKLNVNLNANVVAVGEEVTGENVIDLVNNGGRTGNDDNLRDIGTWSNDHASKRKSAGSNVSNTSNHQRPSAQAAGRFNTSNKNVNMLSNAKNSGGASNQEDWENEEEWQGDLTKTQIFTASTQKKETLPEAKSFDSNFPIGHFNAEEATQNIKKAVGIGAANMTNSSMTNKNSTQENKDIKSNLNQQQHQQQQQQQKKLVIGSVKPPPPSTKIPKSAVIMPEVGSNSSTNFSLDVQFGVDLDQPVTNIVHQAVNASTAQQQIPSQSNTYTNTNLLSEKTKSLNINAIGPIKNVHQSAVSGGSSGSKVLNTDSSIIKPAPISTQPSTTNTTSSVVGSSVNNQVKANNNLDQNLMTKASANQHQINAIPPSSSSQLLHTQTGAQQHQNNNNNFDNIQKKLNQDSQYTDNKNQTKSNFNQQQQPSVPKQQQQQQQLQQAPIKQHHSQQQQYINHLSQSENTSMIHQQQQSQSQQHHQQQHYQHQPSSSNSQLLNVSPQNISTNPKTPNTQQPSALNQLQQHLGQNQANSNSINNSTGMGQGNQLNPTAAAVATAALANANANKTGGGSTVMAPPPGVNMVNPNNQFLMSLPFQQNGLQNFSYFDPSQIDTNSIMQMYNHLANVPPPGVNSATPGAGTAPGPQYPISDSKFNRNDSSNKNSLNTSASAAQLSQQQQQQQPINLIPNLSNFPIFFQHYYPNMFMPMPNGPQANTQQFQPQQQPSKLPYNFNSNTSVGGSVYDDQNKDYNSYNPQTQIKTSTGSNLNNVSDLSGYQKNVEKNNAGGYHTPPPNFSTSLLNQQPHPNTASAQAQPQYTYMIGTPGQNMVHTGIQDNLNARNGGGSNNNSNMKSLPKANQFQNSSWN